MATDQKMMHCPVCDKSTMHYLRYWGGMVHLVLTLMTFGIWLLFWLLGAGKKAPQCSVCGESKRGLVL